MRAVLGFVPDAANRPERGIGRREVTIVEVEGQCRVDVVPDTGDSLVAEFPGVARCDREGRRRLGADLVRQIDSTHADTDMPPNRPSKGAVVDGISHDRAAIALPPGRD